VDSDSFLHFLKLGCCSVQCSAKLKVEKIHPSTTSKLFRYRINYHTFGFETCTVPTYPYGSGPAFGVNLGQSNQIWIIFAVGTFPTDTRKQCCGSASDLDPAFPFDVDPDLVINLMLVSTFMQFRIWHFLCSFHDADSDVRQEYANLQN
jgi:hypothetical protein